MAGIENIGRPFTKHLNVLFDFAIFLFETFYSLFHNLRHGKKLILRTASFQIFFTAVQAIPITVLISIFLFSAIIKQSHIFMPHMGAGMLLGQIFVILTIRELAPLVIAFVLIARSGTAIAAELSTMIVNEEINTLKVIGIDPLYFIVLPRIIGMTISLVCLSFIFTVVTIMGGMILANYFMNIPLSHYVSGILAAASPYDFLINIMKSLIFGLVISFVCCFYGMSTKYSPTEIPQMATKAVIYSFLWCFVFSAVITLLFY